MQRRLSSLGIDVSADELGVFGEATKAAVRVFQERRGLHVDGVCGHDTWHELVEAGYRLGDRFLYLCQPMLRGDDVAEVQRRLGALGFDAGRVDGIFGPLTERALVEFQRNAGLVPDGNCGPATVLSLSRIPDRSVAPEPVVGVRERERLRGGSQSLVGKRVIIGDTGGLHALAQAVARSLTRSGALGIVVQHPDGSEQAAQANGAEADVFVGLDMATGDARSPVVAYFAGREWASPSGRRLAELVGGSIRPIFGAADVRGMGLPVLRETRMPAVLCELAPAETVVAHGGAFADACAGALAAWVCVDD